MKSLVSGKELYVGLTSVLLDTLVNRVRTKKTYCHSGYTRPLNGESKFFYNCDPVHEVVRENHLLTYFTLRR